MKNYYEILEVNSDVSQSEIKKAYFQMIRKYPRDKYEEKFMDIREAYENLNNEETRSQYDSIDSLPDFIKNDYYAAVEFAEEEKLSSAIRKLENILKNDSKLYIVRALLAETYLKNNNSGKAIKLYEELCREVPQNSAFPRGLADAYSLRGWNKKAIKEYKNAIELDKNNIALWFDLSKNYIGTKDYFGAKETLDNALQIFKAPDDTISIYLSLIMIHIDFDMTDKIKEYLDILGKLAENNEDIKDNIGRGLAQIASYLFNIEEDKEANNVIEKAAEILPEDKRISKIKNEIEMVNKYEEDVNRLDNDGNIEEGIKAVISMAVIADNELAGKDKEAIEYAYEYEIMEYFSKYKDSIKRLEKEYPNLYEIKLDFFTKVRNSESRKKLRKEYAEKYDKYSYILDKLNDFYINGEGSIYDNFQSQHDDDHGYDDEVEVQKPFEREEIKIGRNDPCPCGSGKKYKKCCGKNL